ncbi:hypothetical protein LTR29_008746 [Friedmanniomyces endolithicus]|nr:hypothetical protein LTR29_008746 [Friedmanniomyces endolithicus]
MVNYGFILVPLYIYPFPLSLWQPLFDVATSYPNVTFQAVINVDNGPGATNCPNSDYAPAMVALNSHPNIKTLGYIHSANKYNCGAGKDICPCTQPLSALKANITKYQNWNTANCGTGDYHIDGIFLDESPGDGANITYMKNATAFAKSTLTRGNTVLFNAGEAVNSTYWSIADYINVFEDTEPKYDIADIGSLDGQGAYHAQTTLILYNYTDGSSIMQRDVNTILGVTHDAMAGLYITDLDVYNRFPTNFTGFVSLVNAVNKANKAVIG